MSLARFLAKGIDDRAQNIQQLDEIEKNSIDFYAQIRSLYRQNRAQELAGKVVGPLVPTVEDDLYKDPAKSPASQPATQ